MFQPYILKYHLDVASNALVLDGCIRINFANSNGVPKTGEISGMAIGNGRIFVGGSTTGTHVAVDDVPNLVAIRDGVGRNDPAMTVGTLYNADAYVASFDLNLADLQIVTYGTADWEEVLDLEYDDVDGMIYTVGSTHGDMCQAYALGQLYPSVQRISTQVCTTGFKNTSAAANRSNVRFDAYVAAFQWVPGAAHPLKHKAVKQFGADGEDTFNGLAFHRDLSGTARLYVAGKYTPPGRNDMDAKVVRMGVWAAGTTPDAILLNASVETYVRRVPRQHGGRRRDRADRYRRLRRRRQERRAGHARRSVRRRPRLAADPAHRPVRPHLAAVAGSGVRVRVHDPDAPDR